MINNDYLVDTSYMDDSGSYCDFLPIRGEDHLGFKSFKLKARANETYKIQKKLAKFNLAPKLITSVCKIPYHYDIEFLKYYEPKETITSWGYVTEKAILLDTEDTPYVRLQNLVDKIKDKYKIVDRNDLIDKFKKICPLNDQYVLESLMDFIALAYSKGILAHEGSTFNKTAARWKETPIVNIQRS